MVLSSALLLGSFASAQSAEKTVNIGLGYIPNVQFAPFYAAQREGYFAAEGLTAKFTHGYTSVLMPLLLQGKLDFVVADAEEAIFARASGQPVKYVMAVYQKLPVTVFSLPAKNIRTPADLRGKTVGIPGAFGSSYFALSALLSANGLSEQSVRLAPIGFTQLEAVKSGRVDAAVGYVNNEVLRLRPNVRTLDVTGAYPLVGAGLIATQKTLNSDLAAKVVRASQRGLALTVRDPQRAYRDSLPFIGSGGGGLDVLKASVPLIRAPHTLGESNAANWASAIAFLKKQGRVPANFKATDFYSNAYLTKTIK